MNQSMNGKKVLRGKRGKRKGREWGSVKVEEEKKE